MYRRFHIVPQGLRLVAVALAAFLLAGCNIFTRLSEVGAEPALSQIQNPVNAPGYQPVSFPMPPPTSQGRMPNSLWRPGAQAFFKDQRAAQIGDILTVLIEIDDSAELSNTSERSRETNEDASVNSFLGYESTLSRVLPETIDAGSLLDIDGETSNSGSGSIERDEAISLKIAAVVTQVLPNGNLVVSGRQEVRVNYETRQLQVAGVVRREDITSSNTISYDKIAEARIAYGGKGHISDVQQPRYGNQLIDIIFPF